jgi:putative ABC transport system permease protein
MQIRDLFEESYSALVSNKVRTSLTVLGIVIGIGSVVAMVAIGQGSKNSIQESINSLGSNLIMVMPGTQKNIGAGVSSGRGSAQTLTLKDAEAIKNEVANVLAVSPEVSKRYQVTAKGTNTNTTVVGATADYVTVHGVTMEEGSFISQENDNSKAKVAVLGPTAQADLLGTSTSAIGKPIRINGLIFKVIGVTTAKGGSGMSNTDEYIYIPLSTDQSFLSGSSYVSQINVAADSDKTMSTVQSAVTELLLTRHDIVDSSSADFSTMNQADIVSAASGVSSTLTTLLAYIASISLLVGGIGIMNMMLTTVTERTREIGLRKAIGATRANINNQFLTEAVMLTFTGGLLGVFFGWIACFLINKFANMSTAISWNSVLLAFGVSAAIGLIFGYYPARRASYMNPIEALRFE